MVLAFYLEAFFTLDFSEFMILLSTIISRILEILSGFVYVCGTQPRTVFWEYFVVILFFLDQR